MVPLVIVYSLPLGLHFIPKQTVYTFHTIIFLIWILPTEVTKTRLLKTGQSKILVMLPLPLWISKASFSDFGIELIIFLFCLTASLGPMETASRLPSYLDL